MPKKRRTKHSAKFASKAVSSAIRPKGNPEDNRVRRTEFPGEGLDPAYQYRIRQLPDRTVIQRAKRIPTGGEDLGEGGSDWGYFAEIRHSTKMNTREVDHLQAARIIQAIEALGQHRTWLKDNTDELDKLRRVVREQEAKIGRLQGNLLDLTKSVSSAQLSEMRALQEKASQDLLRSAVQEVVGADGPVLPSDGRPDPPSCPHPGYSTVWKHGEDGANSSTLRISCDRCGFVFWDRNKPADPEELRRVVSLADKLGWDGVNNSKMLSVFLKDYIDGLMSGAADAKLDATQARETVRDLESRLAAAESAAKANPIDMKVLKGVNLTDCFLEDCYLETCRLEGCRTERCQFSRSDLSEGTQSECLLDKCRVLNSRFGDCKFSDCKFSESTPAKINKGVPPLPWPETQISHLLDVLTRRLDRQSLHERPEMLDVALGHTDVVVLRDVARWALGYFDSLAKGEGEVPKSEALLTQVEAGLAKQVGSLRTQIAKANSQIDTFISAALVAMKTSPFIILPERRGGHLAEIVAWIVNATAKIASQDEQYTQLSARKTTIEEDLAKVTDKLSRAEGVIRNIGRILNGPNGSPDAQFSPGNVVEMAKDLMHTSNRDSARLKAAYLALRPLVPESSFEEADITADIVDWAKSLRKDLDEAKAESAKFRSVVDLVGSALIAAGKVGNAEDLPGHVRKLVSEHSGYKATILLVGDSLRKMPVFEHYRREESTLWLPHCVSTLMTMLAEVTAQRDDYQSKCAALDGCRTLDRVHLNDYQRRLQTIADILAPNDKRPLGEKPLAKWVGDLMAARRGPSVVTDDALDRALSARISPFDSLGGILSGMVTPPVARQIVRAALNAAVGEGV